LRSQDSSLSFSEITGFHYRSTLVRSNTLGIAVADWVNGNMMMVLPKTSAGRDDEDNDGNYRGIPVQESYDLNNVENEDLRIRR
jgi:hypothetical protein